MAYLPTLRLNFTDGVVNEYRVHEQQIEFRTGDGTWRVLDDEHVQLHLILHTEVSHWLIRELANLKRTGGSTPTSDLS